MRIRDGERRTIDLRLIADDELLKLAHEPRLSRADLVAVVAEMRRRARRQGRSSTVRERHDTPTGRR